MYHEIEVVGNLGRDPEMRYTPSGQAVTNFNVAANHVYNDSEGNQVKQTWWFRVSTWGKTAEACNQYIRKGSRVLVKGRLIADPETGGPKIWVRQDGTSAASFEVNAQMVKFLSSRSEDEAAGVEAGEPAGSTTEPEDIPF